MINEDFCSYEVAKLLKEKGFDGDGGDCECHMFYSSYSKMIMPITEIGLVSDFDEVYYAPTHQMAMKWLREEKNILLYVYPVINLPVKDDYTLFHWRWDGKKKIHAAPHFGDKHHNYESYEEAVEAAIKYSLENLI